MKLRRITLLAACFVTTFVLVTSPWCNAADGAETGGGDEALIREAFEYSFPLFLLSQYRWTALETMGGRTSTTLNHFAHSRQLATPSDTWTNAPSVDELYSTAWIDLAGGPVFIDTPDTHGRYYVLTLIDMYSNTFYYIGHRTTGTATQHYMLVGPSWHGRPLSDRTLIKAPTNDVYVNLRIKTDSASDEPAANAIQDGFTITPQASPVPSGSRMPPVGNDPKNYLDVVNQMLRIDPPPSYDRPLIERYQAVGICGAACSWDRLPDSVRTQWGSLYPKLGDFMSNFAAAGAAHGWIDYSRPGSKLGTADERDYHERAYALAVGAAMVGLSRAEAVYWTTFTDSSGNPLLGSKRYVLRLPADGIPSNAFWSVTLYEVEKNGQFLTPNAIARYAISSSMVALKANADGSIDIYIQRDAPSAGKTANWLPSPATGAAFMLFARSYEPKPAVLDGTFTMPPVQLISR